jgi:hypothetical protein
VIPLVRTEGKTYQSGFVLRPELLVNEAPLSVNSRDACAREAEAALDLGACLYFYAGHACPPFGDIVLVYEPSIIESHQGNAGDHDTGGVCAGYVHFDPPLDEERRREWSNEPGHRLSLAKQREQADRFIGNFSSASAYVRGERALADDSAGRLLHPANERRAWTMVVRFHEDHPVLDGIKLIALEDVLFEALRDSIVNAEGSVRARWNALIDAGTVRQFPKASLHTEVEKLIAGDLL